MSDHSTNANPYLLPEPCVISFSGGRTSGFMLWNVLQAFDGRLPPWVAVVFCNTGKERPETLDFVQECAERWGVVVNWLEYRYTNPEEGVGTHCVSIVDYATASRDGRPFADLQRHRADYRGSKGLPFVLPNAVQRYCTTELKIRTTHRFVTLHLGWEIYHDAIGLRADEPKRVERLRQKRETKVEAGLFGDIKTVTRAASLNVGVDLVFPLHDAGATEGTVMDFWSRQTFDLRLKQHQGNCDLCFLKNVRKIMAIIKERPDLAEWWAAQEEATGARFRQDRPSYRQLLNIVQGREKEPGWLWADKGNDGSCGEMDECRCTD